MGDTLHIEETAGVSLAMIMARRGVQAKTIGKVLGVETPLGPSWTTADGLTLIGTGPGTWLARRDEAPPFWICQLREQLGALASVSDQSSAYSIWRLSGRDARTLLQRGAAIDFDPDSFVAGTVATTVIAHISIIVRQLDDAPTYELATFRSYSGSLRHWLEQSANIVVCETTLTKTKMQ